MSARDTGAASGRLAPLTRARLDSAQARVFDAILAGPRGARPSGVPSGERNPGGPFAPWLRSPELADLVQRLGAFVRYGTTLEPRLSELAILVVGAVWKAEYEFAAHAPIAVDAGLDPEAVDALARGDAPAFAREDERIVYEFALELAEARSVGDRAYRAAVELLGEPGVVELVGILGYYTLVCMTLNAFEVPLDEGMEARLAAARPR